MSDSATLRKKLHHLDNKSYGALKSIKGQYSFEKFTLSIDHIQGDPFADPSRVRVIVPQKIAGFPPELFANRVRQIALRDCLTRHFLDEARHRSRVMGSGKSGMLTCLSPGQEILERSSCYVSADQVEFRFKVGLPADGRRIKGHGCAQMLCEMVPEIVESALLYDSLESDELYSWVKTNEDASAIRDQLAAFDIVAFVADGSLLPRRSGVDDRPLIEKAVPFQSPESLRVQVNCPNSGPKTGMGIPCGVSLIVGGGYHGKSTLLRAIERGVYNHIPKDGREFVVTDSQAVKVRAEDGRQVQCAGISPFINNLPFGADTHSFSTENASGSTSQAANIVEALELDCRVLLIDEDTSATNFMIRDHRMQQLIVKDREPITPYSDKVHQLHADLGVSTVLVMGGSGDYFDKTDCVIAMNEYQPEDVTEKARSIAQAHQTGRTYEGGNQFGQIQRRTLRAQAFNGSRRRRDFHLRTRKTDEIELGELAIDLSQVEQLVEEGQLRSIGHALVALAQASDGRMDLCDLIRTVLSQHQTDVGSWAQEPLGDLCEFRSFELAAAVNRIRKNIFC